MERTPPTIDPNRSAAPAYAAFEESLKGSLTPGKLADIVVVSEDILSVPEERILRARVVYTIVGGNVLLDRIGTQ